MRSAKRMGRLIGMLLFFQLAGLIVPFVLLLPLTTGPRSYLANAVGSSPRSKWLCLSCSRTAHLLSASPSQHFGSFVRTAKR